MSEPRDTREQMAEIYANRDRIRAEKDALPRTTIDENGDVIAAPRADGHQPVDTLSFVVKDSGHQDEEKYGPVGGQQERDFVVKDSGAREQYESGMVRDTAEGKADYTLILDGPMLDRWAEHMTKGAVKYAPRNWMRAEGDAELERFKQSALRHLLQWLRGDIDEDHAAAVIFNINGAEYVKAQKGNT